MRKAILPAVGIAALAITLVGCSPSGKSGVGARSVVFGGNTSAANAAGHAAAGGTSGANGAKGAATSSAGGPCQPDVVVTFCEKFAITGAVAITGTGPGIPEFDQDGAADPKCAAWPNYHPQNSDYPEFQTPMANPVDGHKLQMYWKFPAGVGTSDIAQYAGVDWLTVDGQGYQVTAVDSNDTVATSGSMQVNADGSGTLTFKDLGSGDNRISGTVTWTCVDTEH